MVICAVLEGRVAILKRLLVVTRHCSTNQNNPKSISIGDVTKVLTKPSNPELVPVKYLPKDAEIPSETLTNLKWIMQKDLLGQDVFLIGRPSPLKRQLAMQYLELTGREVEYVALSRDTTESDLKQRREIISGTAHYIDQCAVRAASKGRVLVLEGIEKAERNVLPVLNNLLENREMHLEDGRLLIPASRYDKLLENHTQEELDKWQLVRVSPDFRVIALGLPVPQYVGNPLDPPLRSRFQARDIQHLPFAQQLHILQEQNNNNDNVDYVHKVVSFAHTLVTQESANLGLPDFPIENLPAIIKMLQLQVPLHDALYRLYPYKCFLPPEGISSVEDTLANFQLLENDTHSMYYRIASMEDDCAKIQVGKKKKVLTLSNFFLGNGKLKNLKKKNDYVPVAYHESLLAELLLSHASQKDFCLIGPRGCGKSVVTERLAEMLSYDVEHVMLYQDMTARDLLQQRSTLSNGDTIWKNSPLITAALQGKMAVLDGIHRIHRGTLAVLHRLVHDRELQLYDGTRLMGQERYDVIKSTLKLTDEQMQQDSLIFPIKDNFRIVALAEPPLLLQQQQKQWLTPEILSMFLFHTMRPLSRSEEADVLTQLSGLQENEFNVIEDILQLTHKLRQIGDQDNNSNLASIANSLSTRQLLRIARRHRSFPFGHQDIYEVVHKACLARFLPSLAKEALDQEMQDLGIILEDKKEEEEIMKVKCKVEKDTLTLGKTKVKLFKPLSKTKIPETLFYDTDQNLKSMEAMLQDYMMGQHLLLVGNQGVGKNKLVDRLLKLMNRPREYIQLHRDTTVQSLTLQPNVEAGVIVYQDSPLVKAVKAGHVLVVDEADKAPTHVTCILKTLVESGEMILSDGRRIVNNLKSSSCGENEIVMMHKDFHMMVLANRPGFPFLGNDFFAALGDLFSCHAIDNPSMESELSMLRQYGPDVPEEILRRLVKAFSQLRSMADEGTIQYPYSTREVVNIVKHLQVFPKEGLGQVVRNVFDFDSYDKEARDSVDGVLHKHGIPIGVSSRNISLARQFDLPDRVSIGKWEISRTSEENSRLSCLEMPVKFSDPQQVNVYEENLDRIEARGLGFSEMQTYWNLPFHDFAVVGDVCTSKDKHGRQMYDKIQVVTSNPVWMYSMRSVDDKFIRLPLNHFFDSTSMRSSRLSNVIPRVKIAPMGGRFDNCVALHDEVTNNLLVVEPQSGSVTSVKLGPSSGSSFFDPVRELSRRMTGNNNKTAADPIQFYRMVKGPFSEDNTLLFYTPKGNIVELLNLSGDIPLSYRLQLPFPIQSMHVLNPHQFLLVQENQLHLLGKENEDEEVMPTILKKIEMEKIPNIVQAVQEGQGLTDFGLKCVLSDQIVSSPNTLLVTEDSYATLAMGFPQLEFSSNEIFAWPRRPCNEGQNNSASNPSRAPSYGARQFRDPGRNVTFLRDSCQIIKPISVSDIPASMSRDNVGLSSPGNISAYLEVVDLMDSKLRYVPVPDPAQMSVYSSWYKQTYPDQILALSAMSNEGLVSVDNSGTVRLWETGVANLERSLEEWKRMVGGAMDKRDMMLKRDGDHAGELDSPKHGKIDETGAPHVGGNTWAGGTGGRDTAGLGGVGGPYRMDAGHDVHQVSDEVKEQQVPEHVRKAAREMNRKAYEERLRQIKMSEYDAQTYEKYSRQVRKQVQALRLVINGLQAKAKDRQWLKNQTEGELDDTKLIEGITGEKAIYKRRGEQDPEPGAPQEKPKRLRLLVDVSGSMYRFNGHDQRLERMMESALMVMEALEGYEERVQYDIVGHSGEENDLAFTTAGRPPANENERLQVLKTMHAHAQFCMSGDHTLSATVMAINELANKEEDYDEAFVIVLSDANFDRYGISPANFAKILNRKSDQVNAFAIFIGSLGDQADRLAKKLPAGKAFVCLDTKKIPEVLKTIFTSTMLK